jgi:3-oxoacyl-[acyl-carrier-protein] synthase II
MTRRRVKITGIGPVTAAGIGRDAFWRGILESVSRVRPYTKLGEEYGPLVAAYIDDPDLYHYLDRKLVPKGAARHTVFAIAGGLLALEDAGISREAFGAARSAIVSGSSLMDFGGIGGSIEGVTKKGARVAQPRPLYTTGVGSVASAINTVLGTQARLMSISTQCDSGMDAIGQAADLVARGECDLALCGGTDAPLFRFPILEMRVAGLTPATTENPGQIARPFDMWRTTGVVSEGACMFVLEPESSPRHGYAFLEGYAFATDKGEDLCGGMEAAARLALAEAKMRPAEIDVINAWGPGHKEVDVGEARAMVRLFGDSLANIPVVSIKGAIGTALGGAPAIQIASAALALHNQVIPPTVNWQYPDPECPFRLSNQARPVEHERTLVNAHGLGGVNAAVILRRC